MRDEFNSPKTTLTECLQGQITIESFSANDWYSASTGSIRLGERVESIGLGSKTSVDSLYSPVTGMVRIGDMLESTGLNFQPSVASHSASAERIGVQIFASTDLGFETSAEVCAALSGVVTIGDILGDTGVSFESSSSDLYSASTGSIGVQMFASTDVDCGFKTSADVFSVVTGTIKSGVIFGDTGISAKSSMDLCSASAGGAAVGDMLGSVGFDCKSVDAYSGITGSVYLAPEFGDTTLGFKTSADLFSAVTGTIKLGDMLGDLGVGFRSSDLYSGSANRIRVGEIVGSSGDGFKSKGPRPVTIDFSNLNQRIVGSAQESPANISLFSSPFLVVPAREHYDVAPLGGFTEDFYESGACYNKWRRFEVLLPRQFNDGKNVPAKMLEEAKLEFLDIFGAVSCDTEGVEGLWWHSAVLFRDKLTRILVDAPDLNGTRRRVKEYKERWRLRLRQIDLWVTSCEVRVE